MHNTKGLSTVDLLASTACSIALDSNVDIFICLTETGKIARYIAKYRPFQSILACSTSSAVVKQSNLCRGVIGYKIPTHLCKNTSDWQSLIEKLSDKLIGLVLKVAKDQELVMPGNKVLIFYTENEGKKNESISFKTIDLEFEEEETEWYFIPAMFKIKSPIYSDSLLVRSNLKVKPCNVEVWSCL